jgi:hypothetical protein
VALGTVSEIEYVPEAVAMAFGTATGASAKVTESALFGAKPEPVTVTEPPGATESGVTVAGDVVAVGRVVVEVELVVVEVEVDVELVVEELDVVVGRTVVDVVDEHVVDELVEVDPGIGTPGENSSSQASPSLSGSRLSWSPGWSFTWRWRSARVAKSSQS